MTTAATLSRLLTLTLAPLLAGAALLLCACGENGDGDASTPAPAGNTEQLREAGPSAQPAGEVVLYSSADPEYLRLVTDAFRQETGITVRTVGDTEATKTFGLVGRVLEERDDPRADVWWSSEPFGTMTLAEAGVLEAHTPGQAGAWFGPDGWPEHLRGEDGLWHGFAQRARVIVYNTDRVSAGDVPRTLPALTDPRFRGRVGIARPEFGTTRGHMGAIAARVGGSTLLHWLRALEANDVRVYDGNAGVVRGVATGEIHVGLTDTDDVFAGQRNDWPVDFVYQSRGAAMDETGDAALEAGIGALVLPNTAALVKGGPNPENARRLLDFLLSPATERILAESASRNIPVHPSVARDFANLEVTEPMQVRLEDAAQAIEPAMRIAEEALGQR